MTLSACEAPLHGKADSRLEAITRRLAGYLKVDPDLSFQLAAFAGGEPVIDVWGGPYLHEDSLMVPFSTSKNTIGVSIGLLVERGQLDLDATVASYWPEFAAAGKATVTVRQLLSHQAGLPNALPLLSWDELLSDHLGAERLAATRPFWYPGSAFGYHGLTIGNLASELIFRVTGQTIQQFYEAEIRGPLGTDFYLGLPAGLESRLVPVLDIIPPLAGPRPAPVSPMARWVFGPHPGPQLDLANSERSWRFGHPAGSSTATARGIASVLAAAVTGLAGSRPLLSAETVGIISQQQVRGYDEVLGQQDRAHAIVFQKPSGQFTCGGPRSFGHDGAQGAFGWVDPDSSVAFAYTIARGPWPGGADPRAVQVAGELMGMTW